MTAMKNPRQVPLAVLLLSISLAAPGTAQGNLIRLGTSHDLEYFHSSGQNSSGQTVAVMKDGRFAVVWTQFLQSPHFGAIAHVQYIRGDGSTVLGPHGRAVTSSNLDRATSVVAHAEGGVLVALERYDPDSRDIRLVVQRLDGGGRPRWHQGVSAAPVSRVEDQSGGPLLASSDGGAFACFIRAALQPNANVFCQRFSADGQRLWGSRAVQAVTSNSTYRLEPPLAISDGNDGLLVFWRDVRPGRGPGTVTFRGQRLGPDGSRLWGDEGRIVYKRRLPSKYGVYRLLNLVSDGNGGAILAFNDWPGPPSPIETERVVIVQRVSGDGDNLWGSGGLVVTSGDRELDSLIAGPDGGAFVGVFTYLSNYSTRLAFHRITADGRSIWPADGVPIVDPAVDDRDNIQAFGSFNDGVLRLAWMTYEPVFRWEIRFGALDADGNRLAGAAGILLAPADSQKGLEGFAVNPETGTVFATWVRRDRGGDTDVHGAVYDSSPALTPAPQSTARDESAEAAGGGTQLSRRYPRRQVATLPLDPLARRTPPRFP